jgi:nucleotidyltransferase substrate binding protein (TIGR01987 family)
MEKINSRYKAMQKALSTLQEGIQEMSLPLPGRPKAYLLMRDGVTQRFEYCIDSYWKFFKFYLEMVSKIIIEQPISPKIIFREALYLKLISEAEHKVLNHSVTQRNLTSHTYDEKTAEKIHEHIPLYYQTMKTILDRLNIE